MASAAKAFKSHSSAYKTTSKRLPRELIEGLIEKDSERIDRNYHAAILDTIMFAPPAVANTAFDWLINLAYSPGKQLELSYNAVEKLMIFLSYNLFLSWGIKPEPSVSPLPQDRRFDDEGWKNWPYDIYKQTFLLNEKWWMEATEDIRGVSQHHSELLPFLARQYLDAFAPLNFPCTNPVVTKATMEKFGFNFIQGGFNFIEDLSRRLNKQLPVGAENFKVGENIACTKGKVIYQNQLIELIQYAPTTESVYAEPILIVPAWIMKYYILDLSPHNSLVKYLVDKGHTVFMISWKNPGPEEANLGLEEYLDLGILKSLDAVSDLFPNKKINAAGYCLGGTLLSIAAAKLAREKDDLLNSVTLFAAQVDFEEAGELLFFIDEAQLTYLEDSMAQKGYLEAYRMAGTFYMLRSYDMIWSKLVEEYYLGERSKMIDLMAWNADATRMPYKMHSQYLRSLFLNNDLSNGKFNIGKEPIVLSDIKAPMFAVSTVKDHVSPWESVYKIHFFIDTDITYVLTTGGHNAGIVSEIGHPHRKFQMKLHKRNDIHLSPEEWQTQAKLYDGSWWPKWNDWLAKQSSGKIKAPGMGNTKKGYKPLRDAPGKYVLER